MSLQRQRATYESFLVYIVDPVLEARSDGIILELLCPSLPLDRCHPGALTESSRRDGLPGSTG